MKLWKSKKSLANTTTSCVSVVTGKLNLASKSCNNHSTNNRQQNNYDDDKIETISAASTATVTNQPANDMTQGGCTFKQSRLSIRVASGCHFHFQFL